MTAPGCAFPSFSAPPHSNITTGAGAGLTLSDISTSTHPVLCKQLSAAGIPACDANSPRAFSSSSFAGLKLAGCMVLASRDETKLLWVCSDDNAASARLLGYSPDTGSPRLVNADTLVPTPSTGPANGGSDIPGCDYWCPPTTPLGVPLPGFAPGAAAIAMESEKHVRPLLNSTLHGCLLSGASGAPLACAWLDVPKAADVKSALPVPDAPTVMRPILVTGGWTCASAGKGAASVDAFDVVTLARAASAIVNPPVSTGGIGFAGVVAIVVPAIFVTALGIAACVLLRRRQSMRARKLKPSTLQPAPAPDNLPSSRLSHAVHNDHDNAHHVDGSVAAMIRPASARSGVTAHALLRVPTPAPSVHRSISPGAASSTLVTEPLSPYMASSSSGDSGAHKVPPMPQSMLPPSRVEAAAAAAAAAGLQDDDDDDDVHFAAGHGASPMTATARNAGAAGSRHQFRHGGNEGEDDHYALLSAALDRSRMLSPPPAGVVTYHHGSTGSATVVAAGGGAAAVTPMAPGQAYAAPLGFVTTMDGSSASGRGGAPMPSGASLPPQ